MSPRDGLASKQHGEGVITKVSNPQNNTLEWRFQSVSHSAHGVNGFYTLMTITPEVQNYNPVVGLYNFIVSFNLHVTYSLLFNGFPVTRERDYPCSNSFSINQGVE